MKAELIRWAYGNYLVVVTDNGMLVAGVEFANEFAAQTYADAINMGVIQHVEA